MDRLRSTVDFKRGHKSVPYEEEGEDGEKDVGRRHYVHWEVPILVPESKKLDNPAKKPPATDTQATVDAAIAKLLGAGT